MTPRLRGIFTYLSTLIHLPALRCVASAKLPSEFDKIKKEKLGHLLSSV